VLGWVSLLTDASSEMIFPLLPAFLAARLGNPALLIGAMEGLADLTASGLKYASGRWTDRAARLKPLIVFGYGLAGAVRPLMAFVAQWWQPLAIRVADRVGKGVRTSPRDALIALAVDEKRRGRAFGFHRAMDHAGAALGSLLAMGLLAAGLSVTNVILLAWVPAAIALVAVSQVEEPAREVTVSAGALAPVPRRLGWYLVPVTLFSLGNATDAFLLLKLSQLGASATLMPLAWLTLHAVKSAVSTPAGALADRVGTARVVWSGWVLYAVSYALLAFAHTVPQTFAVIAFYGLYHALSEGAEKSLLTQLTPKESRGRAFGLYHGLSGVSSLAAGLLFGTVWNAAGSKRAFLLAGALALVAAVLLPVLLPRARASEA
jgi:MFS family permease